MTTELVTIALCTEETEWHNQDIYIGDGWNIQPANDFLGFTGRVLSKHIQQKPDWLDLSFADAKEIGIIETIAKGFWILEIDSRTVVACFGGSADFLNQEKLDTRFTPYRIEVKNENLKSEVLDYMKSAIKTIEPLGLCSFCGDRLTHPVTCYSCETNQGTEYLETIMARGKCDLCGEWKMECNCN